MDSSSDQCGLNNCSINYLGGNPNNQTSINLSGSNAFVNDCTVFQQPRAGMPDGPHGCKGIVISSATAALITGSHVSNYDVGITIDDSTSQVQISNVISESWTSSLVIEPTHSGGTIYQVFVDNCSFEVANKNAAASTAAGIVISEVGSGSTVADVYLGNCVSLGWGLAGLQIAAGQNIQVNGGRFGANSNPSSSGSGIAITGAATNIIVDGADCSGVAAGQPYTQAYGISVTANVNGAFINNCNLTGSSTKALNVTAGNPNLQVTECSGYNDQPTVFATNPPVNATFMSTYHNYYGPISFFVGPASGGTSVSISINGSSTNLAVGSFSLAPGGTAKITCTVTPPLLAVGR
jgi:hypothetical protein